MKIDHCLPIQMAELHLVYMKILPALIVLRTKLSLEVRSPVRSYLFVAQTHSKFQQMKGKMLSGVPEGKWKGQGIANKQISRSSLKASSSKANRTAQKPRSDGTNVA